MDEIPLLILLLLLSGFFSGAEIALFSVGSERIHALKKEASPKQKKRIEALEKLKSKPNQLLVTILIGNNVVNVAASAMATVVAFEMTQDSNIVGGNNSVVAIVTGVMTFLILMFGEITPKALANKHAISFSLFSTPIIRLLKILLMPLVIPLSKVVSTVAKEEDIKHGLSEEELKAAIHLSEQEGAIEYEERELVENMLELDEHAVNQIMTPRSKMFSLNGEMILDDALPEIIEQNFSRIPIYQDTEDNIIGILNTKFLIELFHKNNTVREKQLKDLPLKAHLKTPPTTKIHTIMKQFQAENTSHMALVYDEHGGLIGLLTLEDVLEEVFGEIHDETDEAAFQIKKLHKNTFQCNSDVELKHLEQFIRKRRNPTPELFPWKETDDNKTLSYYLLEQFERFPQAGEKLEAKGDHISFQFTIREVKDQTIKLVDFSIS